MDISSISLMELGTDKTVKLGYNEVEDAGLKVRKQRQGYYGGRVHSQTALPGVQIHIVFLLYIVRFVFISSMARRSRSLSNVYLGHDKWLLCRARFRYIR